MPALPTVGVAARPGPTTAARLAPLARRGPTTVPPTPPPTQRPAGASASWRLAPLATQRVADAVQRLASATGRLVRGRPVPSPLPEGYGERPRAPRPSPALVHAHSADADLDAAAATLLRSVAGWHAAIDRTSGLE
jgi:hypothetical protein